MVHEQTDPAGQFCAGTLSPSDCHPVGPVGLVATGGPVGPDVCFTNPNLLTHVIRTPPDPDGQDATAGPVGPYVRGGPVGPVPYLPTQVIRTSPTRMVRMLLLAQLDKVTVSLLGKHAST